MTESKTSGFNQAAATLFFAVASLAAVVWFLDIYSPRPYRQPEAPNTDYDAAAMQAAVSVPNVQKKLDDILALGSRFPGSSGFYKCETMIRQAFEAAGLDVLEQTVNSALPQTSEAHFTHPQSGRLDIPVHPFLPNHIQPGVTPPNGLTGRLILLNEERLRQESRLDDCIGVIDAGAPKAKGYGYDWTRYAQLGVRAVVVAHRVGLAEINWTALSPMVSGNPVNYVRVVAGPEIFAHLGESLNLKVMTRFQAVPTKTIVGRLKSERPATEALVIPVTYDASSVLPTASPGTLQAHSLAIQLQVLQGVLPYREQLNRDVIFVALGSRTMANDGMRALIAAIGARIQPPAVRQRFHDDQMQKNETRQAHLKSLLEHFDDDAFFAEAEPTQSILDTLAEAPRQLLEAQCTYVLNRLVAEAGEAKLQAKVAFERTGDVESEAYQRYQELRKRYDKAFSAAGFPLVKLLKQKTEYVTANQLRSAFRQRLLELQRHHENERARIAENQALQQLFRSYQGVTVLSPQLMPSASKSDRENLAFSLGYEIQKLTDQGQQFKDLLLSAIQRLELSEQVTVFFTGSAQGQDIHNKTSGIPLDAQLWSKASYPAFSVVHGDRSYKAYVSPVSLPWMRDVSSMRHGLQVFGEVMLSLAFGNGSTAPLPRQKAIHDYYGNVYMSNIGQSIIPNFPVAGALLSNKTTQVPQLGRFAHLFFFTDVYGHYDYRHCIAPFVGRWGHHQYSPDACLFGQDGIVSHMKDNGTSAQAIYKSVNLKPTHLSSPVNLVLYRGAPVSIIDMVNSQTLDQYASAQFVRSKGLAPFASTNVYSSFGLVTEFVKPDERFVVKLKAGSVDNEKVQITRAFMLGTMDDVLATSASASNEKEVIAGAGYLASDHAILHDIPFEIGKSMLDVNGKRLALQDKHSMADERTQSFHEKGVANLKQAQAVEATKNESILRARDAVTYATLNHPVLRRNVSDAVWGIIWYLGLLVPFAFFFEKLVFGFADVRKQIAAQAVVFLCVFALLRILHPAFDLIRSSLMVLLGFVIMLISLGITVLFVGKAKENLEAIRKRRGQVSAAEVNTLGVIATAFMLGLNNMHRRRVRTGLTCATLVLLTFVMICFTSMQDNVVNQSIATGKANYQGFLVKNERYVPVSDGELSALRKKYGERFAVCPRRMYVGTVQSSTQERRNPDIVLTRRPDGERLVTAEADSILRYSSADPVQRQFELVAGTWFTPEQEQAEAGAIPILISEEMARTLKIQPSAVGAGDARVQVNNGEFIVQGIFSAAAFNAAVAVDGQSLKPFDVTALLQVSRVGSSVTAEETDPKMEAERLIIAPNRDLGIQINDSVDILHAIVVRMPDDTPYKEAKQEVARYLEQSGEAVYYGLDGVAFNGKRTRERNLEGLLELLVPLILAALTVLNTMKGSVYERRDEIFVYNAVGIAPRYIFFMFFAEAIVYAVVGAELGYILSQGVGKVMSALDMTGGMHTTYTSLNTIYASWTISAAVFLSTWFPARSAMEVAAPSDDGGWRLPKSDGSVLRFNLPFTFDRHDRIAVLSFFYRYFVDHGEGSSGAFFAGPPELVVSDRRDSLADDAYIPSLRVKVWPKPFDLGVSQEVTIELGTDPETEEFIATIELQRLSGTLENWTNLNHRFVGLLRRHFLFWRAVPAGDRQEMFAEARELLTQTSLKTEEPA